MIKASIRPIELATIFHAKYEEFAIRFGYRTRRSTRRFDPLSANGKLMVAVCEHLIDVIERLEEEPTRAHEPATGADNAVGEDAPDKQAES